MLVRRPSTASRARPFLALIAVGAASLTLAGCAAQDSQKTDLSGTEGDVQDVVQKLADRADAGDSASICRELFTERLQASLSQGGACADNLEKAINNADYTSLDVKTVRLIGASNQTEAQALVKTLEDDGERQINLVKGTDGKWRIDALQTKVTPPTSPTSTPPATVPATKAK